MDDTSTSNDEEDEFFDAIDEFIFYDCPETFESSQLIDDCSSISSSVDPTSGRNLRRRPPHRKLRRNSTNLEIRAQKSLDLSVAELTPINGVVSSAENSTITAEERRGEIDDVESSVLMIFAELLVKLIGFQFNLMISLITFPFSALYYGLMMFINPFYVFRLGRSYVNGKLMKLWKGVYDLLSPYLSEWIKEHKSWLNVGVRVGWGLLWAVYVCSVLVSLLVLAFVVGGVMMKFYVLEEPFQLKQALNFDYTRSKPCAFVPITSCRSVECGEKLGGGSGGRVVPRNQKLEATVIVVLPESDYNRNLGIFQVRVNFLSENGETLATLSHPCMLGFKSEPVRLLLTFFKIIPLVAGYVSETQVVTLKFNGYTESVVPTGCLKVTIEQRAEFRSQAGIPEIYDAFLHLESELSFLKRILWFWRKTIFVWLSMTLFIVELLFALLCCTPLVFPRARTRSNAARNDGPSRNHLVQR
ncbi:hypothetical protein vseg_007341 [Gypsophila vaccaria]